MDEKSLLEEEHIFGQTVRLLTRTELPSCEAIYVRKVNSGNIVRPGTYLESFNLSIYLKVTYQQQTW